MLILVDSREQLPYWTGSQCAKTALNVGDYTTASLLNRFHIERKSASDLYGTIVHNHPRFRHEILRAKDARITLVVVAEVLRDDFIALRWSRVKLKMKPETLDRILTTVETRYGLNFVWCKSRIHAKSTIEKILRKEETKYLCH